MGSGLVRIVNRGGGYKSLLELISGEVFRGAKGGLSEAIELVGEGSLIFEGSPEATS